MTLATAAAFAVLYIGGAGASLTGSTFGGGDGNLTCNDANGALDWNCLSTSAGSDPQLNIGVEQFSGQNDNSFGQGTKEDDSNVSLVDGSIPPNKSDLTRFYEASQAIAGYADGTHILLYLAWERTNVLGSANMDFEINKTGTPCLSSPVGQQAVKCTINRSVGDILVTYDFTNGGGTPTIGLRTWNGSSWQTDNTVVAESAVNTGTVNDTRVGDLAANTFGEAAVDLTASGLISPGSCGFAQATTFLKSRSAASFTSEIKDFVAPISTPLNPCSSITIIKHTLNGAGNRTGVDQSFGYTTTGTGLSSFSLNDSAGTDNTSNTKVFSGLGPGSYSVTETLPVANFAFTDLSCVATGSGTSATPASGNATPTASITLAFGGSATCTYTNQQQLGAIKITKTSSKGTHPVLAGAVFSIKSGGTPITGSPFTTGSDGTVCVDHLPFGTYSVQETAAPTGYSIDDTTAHDVAVNANSTCGDGNEATFSATDTPLSKITVSFQSLAGPGVTSATIDCGGGVEPLPEATPKVLNNLPPGTYSCTVVVDP